jgi:hypothetical protein
MPLPLGGNATPKVEYIGSETAFSLYVNSVEMGVSPWDVRMKIGELMGQKDNVAIVKHHGTIVMAPAHAKAMFGEIDLARIQQEVAKTNP